MLNIIYLKHKYIWGLEKLILSCNLLLFQINKYD